MVGNPGRVAWIVLACAGCLDARRGDADRDAGGVEPGGFVRQLYIGDATIRAAAGQDGDVFITGVQRSALDVGGEHLAAPAGGQDLYLARVRGDDGGVDYLVGHGAAGAETADAIAVDPVTDDVVVTGIYTGIGSAGGAEWAAPPAGEPPSVWGFVARYDAAGAHRWSNAITGPGSIVSGPTLSLDGASDALVGGFFDGELHVGGSQLMVQGPFDIFYLAVRSGGELIAARQYGGVGPEAAYGAVYAGGPVYLTGTFVDDFSIVDRVVSGDGTTLDGYLASISTNGVAAEWAIAFRGAGVFGQSVGAPRADGGVYLATWFDGQVVVPLDPEEAREADGLDVLLLSVDRNGNVEWALQLGGPGDGYPLAAAVAPDGSILVTGGFNGTLDVGDQDLDAVGADDGFVAVVDPTGEIRWAARFGGLQNDAGTAIVPGAGDTLYVGALFRGTVDFGGPAPLGDDDADLHAALIELAR
jgi:hypothetical protein